MRLRSGKHAGASPACRLDTSPRWWQGVAEGHLQLGQLLEVVADDVLRRSRRCRRATAPHCWPHEAHRTGRAGTLARAMRGAALGCGGVELEAWRSSSSSGPAPAASSCRPRGGAAPGSWLIATPNCLRVFMYSAVMAQGLVHHAHGLGAGARRCQCPPHVPARRGRRA